MESQAGSEHTVEEVGFFRKELNNAFFANIASILGIHLLSWREEAVNNLAKVSTAMGDAVNRSQKLTGIFKFVLVGKDSTGQNKEIVIALKSKRNAIENTAGWIAGFEHTGEKVFSAAKKFWPVGLSFDRAPELEVMAARRAMVDPHLASFRPTDYFTILDVKRERFVVVSEYMAEEDVEIGGVFDSAPWTQQNRFRVLSEMAKFHAHYFGNTDGLSVQFGDAMVKHTQKHLKALPFWQVVVEALRKMYPDPAQFTADLLESLDRYLMNIKEITEEEESYPMTLIHNDMHPANMWLRKNPVEGKSDLVLYDWETCAINVPQCDLVWFMNFAVVAQSSPSEHLKLWTSNTEHYRHELIKALQARGGQEKIIKIFEDKKRFNRILCFQVYERFYNRLNILLTMHGQARAYIPCDDWLENVLMITKALTEEVKPF